MDSKTCKSLVFKLYLEKIKDLFLAQPKKENGLFCCLCVLLLRGPLYCVNFSSVSDYFAFVIDEAVFY